MDGTRAAPQRRGRLTAYSGQFQFWAALCQAELRGTMRHQHDGRLYRFESTLDVLTIIDKCLDRIGAAEVGFAARHWTAREQGRGEDLKRRETEIQPTEAPQFMVNVLRRQNATWQGTVQWLEGGKKQHFRSMLELVRLMEEVIAKAPIPADDLQIEADPAPADPEEDVLI